MIYIQLGPLDLSMVNLLLFNLASENRSFSLENLIGETKIWYSSCIDDKTQLSLIFLGSVLNAYGCFLGGQCIKILTLI